MPLLPYKAKTSRQILKGNNLYHSNQARHETGMDLRRS